ncbi:hypothetical protein E2C01_038262 [Portunus trituberculatus]|uniref:Uncharacterized protein n=1 Tax=Portunus trituberculatus TaxID=210409 RepID=A0A5B7FGC7_PORTR|nr:hypothetical protein [Portunus trituberculatus]
MEAQGMKLGCEGHLAPGGELLAPSASSGRTTQRPAPLCPCRLMGGECVMQTECWPRKCDGLCACALWSGRREHLLAVVATCAAKELVPLVPLRFSLASVKSTNF